MHRIALIDDHRDTRDLLGLFLALDPQLAITAYESADPALQDLKSGTTFDLIISDLSMPGTDGIEFMRIIRNELHFLDIPAVAVTAHAADYYIASARAAGFNEYLIKPIDPAELLACVYGLLLKRTVLAGTPSHRRPTAV